MSLDSVDSRRSRLEASTSRSASRTAGAIRIVHVLPGLKAHGAELQLLGLVSRSDRARFHHDVISLTSMGSLGTNLEHLGIGVYTLGLPDVRSVVSAPWKFRALMTRLRPDLVHGWLYDGNLAALLATVGRRHRRPKRVWCVLHALNAFGTERFKTKTTIRLGARWSGSADRIVYNSSSAMEQHEKIGYCARRSLVIPNGVDSEVFRPGSSQDRNLLHAELGVGSDTLLVGVTARYHPLKDFSNLAKAAALVAGRMPRRVIFALAGRGLDERNQGLVALIEDAGAKQAIRLLGERRDIPRLLAGCDIACLSSLSEALPNALTEAMACGIPCVATDVGDCRELVGNTGVIVPPRNPSQLAEGIIKLLQAPREEREALGHRARKRVVDEYSLDLMVDRFESVYKEAVR